jgi:hypothetical protein
MMDEEFHTAIASLRALPFREDFEAGLYDLYKIVNSSQRFELRLAWKANTLGGPKTWRNPVDFERSDLTREQRMRQSLIRMSIQNGGRDFRDDLMSIAYCYHNLILLSVDADAELEELAKISAPNFAHLLRGWVRRSPVDKSPESFKLKIEQTPDGPVADFTH